MKLWGRHYRTGTPVEIEIAGETILAVRSGSGPSTTGPVPWVAPGFVDLQVNGYCGQEFSSAQLTVDHVAQVAEQMLRFGVTRFLPTLTTASDATLKHALTTLARACEDSRPLAARLPGIHLEGPYLSPEDGPRGAHPRAHCRVPDWQEFCRLQEAARGKIRLLTMAVEFRAAPAFIARAVASGVVVAIGHTAASAAQIKAAVDAGATLSTHLGNGAHPLLPRHPNYLWDQLADDRLTASLIVDGHHLPPATVKAFVRAKTPERVVLVSDLSGMAGLPLGRYTTEFCALEILPDGRLVVAGQNELLAGASRPIGDGIANVMRFAGVDLAAAVDMASVRPAQLAGLAPAEMAAGARADLVLFDLPTDDAGLPTGLTVLSTICGGQALDCQA